MQEGLAAAGEDRVGRFVEQLANGPVTLLGDSARPVEFARLVAPGHQAELGAGIPRLSEAGCLIHRSGKGGGCLHTNTWDGHEDRAGV